MLVSIDIIDASVVADIGSLSSGTEGSSLSCIVWSVSSSSTSISSPDGLEPSSIAFDLDRPTADLDDDVVPG